MLRVESTGTELRRNRHIDDSRGDTYVSLADRAAFADRVRKCIFVSIHFNEDNKPVASGVETLLRRTSNNRGFVSGLVAAFSMATAFRFAESRKPEPRRTSFRKPWSRAPGPWIGAQKPDNFS